MPRSKRASVSSRSPTAALPLRRVQLDFHTSPFIPDVGRMFDAREHGATFRKAHVQSVTVVAKCHHGMCYYSTATGHIIRRWAGAIGWAK